MISLDSANASESVLQDQIIVARRQWKSKSQNNTMHACLSQVDKSTSKSLKCIAEGIDKCTLQSVALILFAAATETPISRIASPIFQGLIDLFGGGMAFSSKTPPDSNYLYTYKAVAALLKDSVDIAKIGLQR